jgi:hypothetical protein
MGNQQSTQQTQEEDDFIVINSRNQELTGLEIAFNFTKTATVFALYATGRALNALSGITASASKALIKNFLPVKQDFRTGSQKVVQFEGITFFITGNNTLSFHISSGIFSYKFQMDVSSIEMFRLTDEICFFLLHTTDGKTVASVYTSQYHGDFNRLKLTTIADSENQFERFEAEVCMYGTVSMTVFYKNGTQNYFQIERDGTFNEIEFH